ncbi:MAG: TonB-dependent receptor [Pseudomonadota bacterium]
MNRFSVVLIFLVIFLPTYGMALEIKDNIHKMDEVVVTATNKTKAIDTPASLSIITGKELEEMGAKNVVDALGKIPGVVDSSTNSRTVVIRGNKSAMAGGPVILIDGVPQKMGDYQYSEFNFIPITQIEHIEVLRSAGIAYGPGAARGVINVITKKTKKEGIHGNASASYGSWDTHDENASINGRQKKVDYLLNAGNFHTDGYEHEEENRLSVLAKLGYHLSDQTRIGLRFNYIDYDIDTAEGFRKKTWQLDNYRREIHFPKSETDSDLIWHNEKEQENSTFALEFSHNDENKFIDSALSWTGYDEEFRRLKDLFDNPSGVYYENSEQDAYVFTISSGYYFDFDTISYTPSIGLNFENIDNEVSRIYPFNPGKNTDKYNFDLQEQLYGIFWDNDFLFQDKWGLKVGGRLDRAQVNLKDKVPTVVDQDRTMFSYLVAPSFHFSDKANIYVSAGRNYWFPTPRYYAWAVENGGTFNPAENLEPEAVLTYEIGYKHMLHKSLNINATLYFSDYKDKFGSVYDGATYHGQGNIGDARAKGIELEADGRLSSFFGYRLAGAYQDIKWTSGTTSSYLHPSNTYVRDADLTGNQIYWVPKFSGVLGLDFFPLEGLKVSMDMNYMGKRYVDYLNRIEYPAKTTFDARVSYARQRWKVWLLGKNIFDEDLEYVSNSSGRLTGANGEPDSAYFVQDGAYFEAGISYSF